MRLDFHDYTELVTAELNKKKIGNSLPLLLVQPTPANIRRECENVYKERYDKKDEPAQRAFFGPVESGKQFLQLIQNFPTDKFKPLVNFLKGGTEKTDEKNIELLAWLIDFRHRPYGFGNNVSLTDQELAIIGKRSTSSEDSESVDVKGDASLRKKEPNEVINKINSDPQTSRDSVEPVSNPGEGPNPHKPRFPTKALIIALIVLAICTTAIFITWTSRVEIQPFTIIPNAGCMYWAEDHYERMPCEEDKRDKLKLPIDVVKMRNFRRILREDTITEKSIGKVYYLRIDGRIEYYTTYGNHPIDNTRVLQVLTTYIYEKHLKERNSSKNKNS